MRFEKATFCSSNCKFLKFSAYNMSLLLGFFTFLFLIMYLQLSIPHCIVKYLPPKFNVMFEFNYSKYNPGGKGGRAYTWKEFSVSKVGS